MSNHSNAKTSPFDDEQLTHFKELLTEKKKETKQEIERMRESLDNVRSSKDEQSGSAHHQADIGTEEEEREKFLIMIEKNEQKLDEITAALDRITRGTYGICERTGDPIQKERLEAMPEARLSMKAKRSEQ